MTIKKNGLALLLVAFSANLWAHGDVVPQAVKTDGLEPVEAAVREALASGTASDELILNILSRRREPATPHSIVTSEDRMLQHPPLADCARYDLLRGYDAAA